jgi:hypothetical protein
MTDGRARRRRAQTDQQQIDRVRSQLGQMGAWLRRRYIQLGRLGRDDAVSFVVVVPPNAALGHVESISGDVSEYLKGYVENPGGWKSSIDPDDPTPDGFIFWGSDCHSCENTTHGTMICDSCGSDEHTLPLYIANQQQQEITE